MSRDVLAIDVSYYQKKIQGPFLAAQGVELVIAKADVRFAAHAAQAGEGGQTLGAYVWADPTVSAAVTTAACLERIKGWPVRFIAVDFEQWWAVWAEWTRAVTKKVAWSTVRKLAPKTISRRGLQLCQRLETEGYPVIVYTSRGFVTSHAPQAAGWLSRYPLWAAHYRKQPSQKTLLTWDQLKGAWLPDYEPLLPPGCAGKSLVGHQFTGDRVRLPGIYADDRGSLGLADVSVFDRAWLKSL